MPGEVKTLKGVRESRSLDFSAVTVMPAFPLT